MFQCVCVNICVGRCKEAQIHMRACRTTRPLPSPLDKYTHTYIHQTYLDQKQEQHQKDIQPRHRHGKDRDQHHNVQNRGVPPGFVKHFLALVFGPYQEAGGAEGDDVTQDVQGGEVAEAVRGHGDEGEGALCVFVLVVVSGWVCL